MTPLNKLYQLRLFGHIDQYPMENIFFYNHISGEGFATDLALAFESDVLNNIIPLQVANALWEGIQCYNMGDYSDFVNLPLATSGSYGDVPREPVFVAVGYSLKLNTRAIRQGSKRFSGIPSEVSNEEIITSAGYLASMEALRLALLANVTGSGDVWEPTVIKRVKTPVAGTVPLKYRYNLPVPPATTADTGKVVAVTTSSVLTSQVSRKG